MYKQTFGSIFLVSFMFLVSTSTRIIRAVECSIQECHTGKPFDEMLYRVSLVTTGATAIDTFYEIISLATTLRFPLTVPVWSPIFLAAISGAYATAPRCDAHVIPGCPLKKCIPENLLHTIVFSTSLCGAGALLRQSIKMIRSNHDEATLSELSKWIVATLAFAFISHQTSPSCSLQENEGISSHV